MVTQTRGLFEKYTDPAQFARIIEMDTVTEMWRRCQAEFPEAEAIVDNGVSYTFARLESDAAGFRTVLAESAPGSRVALFAANSYDFVKAYLATVTSGRTAVIFPAQLDAASVFGCCMMFGVSTLVYQPDFADRVALAEQRIPGLRLIPADTLSDEKTPMADCTGDTPCCIVFTGGTTGRSKGALLSHEAVMQGTVNGCYGYQDVFSQRYLLILPLSHVFGLIRNLMTSLYTGSTLFICRSNKDMFRDIAVFRPTILVMVPALAEMALTLSKKFGRNMLGADLKYIICGAAAVSPYLVGEYHKLGITLCPGYGLTESANLVSGNPESLSKPDSVGIPYPNQELRVVNGELWLKGRNMMTGYVGADGSEAYEDGWFKTGDLVRFDEDGYLYITGRIKEIIVLSNGENVSPAEVEAHFNRLDCVQDSQVFEDVNDFGAHILALEVVPRATQLTDMDPEERKAYITAQLEQVNAALPTWQQVSKITVRDSDFARTPAMKIVRYQKCQ
ncbi:MAG: AMP-binding protein [Oscillospiraceae bacterium]|nr:AMP-binding protein [Oscillospiraceae bacterium]